MIGILWAGHFLRQMIPFIGGEPFIASTNLGNGFPLYHADLSTSNIFVDGDLNITCIIDWAFASTVPLSTAHMNPGLPHPRDDTDPALECAFRKGLMDHRFQGGYTAFALELWEHARRAWLFTRLAVLGGERDYYYFKELYLSVWKPEEVSISGLLKAAQAEPYFIELAEDLAYEEEVLLGVLEEEEEYFTPRWPIARTLKEKREAKLKSIERRAIARKVTLVSGLSQDFVADERLWRWIEEMVQDLNTVESATEI